MIITPHVENPKAMAINLTNTVTGNPHQTMVVTQNHATRAISIATAADKNSRETTENPLFFIRI